MSAPKFDRARGLSNVFNVSEEMTSHLKAVIAAILSAILMGGLCIFVRESDCSAQLCSFARFFVGASLMLCIIRRSFRFSSKAFGSGASIGLCILFYFLAIKSVPAGIAALLLYTGPIFAVAGESELSRRMPPLRDLCLITVSVFGIVLVSLAPGMPGDADLCGMGYGLCAGFFYAIYIFLNRKISASVTLSRRTFWQFVGGGAILLPPLFLCETAFPNALSAWAWLIAIGVVHGFVVLLLVAYAIRKLPAVQFGTVSYLEPVVAVGVGCFFYGETVSFLQGIGFVLVLIASAIQTCFTARKSENRLS